MLLENKSTSICRNSFFLFCYVKKKLSSFSMTPHAFLTLHVNANHVSRDVKFAQMTGSQCCSQVSRGAAQGVGREKKRGRKRERKREQKVTQSAYTFTHPLNLSLFLSVAAGVVFQERSAIVIKGVFTFLAFFSKMPARPP